MQLPGKYTSSQSRLTWTFRAKARRREVRRTTKFCFSVSCVSFHTAAVCCHARLSKVSQISFILNDLQDKLAVKPETSSMSITFVRLLLNVEMRVQL